MNDYTNDSIKPKSFQDIKNNLSLHVNNKFLFREDQVRTYNGVTFNSTNWSSKNMRRIYFSECTFTNVDFHSAGFTGSIFRDCIFISSNLNCTIFDECIFSNCKFIDMDLASTSFCKAEFNQCIFDDLNLNACFFTDALFSKIIISNCKLTDIIWENAHFFKCQFYDTQLEKLNFEFTHFNDISFNNTSIPFASLPFVFGGINYLMNTNDPVFIKTVHPLYPDGKMSGKEYISLLPDLISFYKYTQNYFPLANMLLGMDRLSDGINAIYDGLDFWFHIHNYKMMYYLCELSNEYRFSISNRKAIFKIIEKYNEVILRFDNIELEKRWNNYQIKMRECLLNPQSIPHVTLNFATSISEKNYLELSEFMSTVESILIPKQCYFNLELRHNSPFDLLYTIFGDEQTLFDCVVGIITILGVCNQVYSNWINNKKLKNRTPILSDEDKKKVSDKISSNVTNVHYNFYNCNINNIMQDGHFTKQSIGCENCDSSGNNQ